jgi:non-heme chloroperoxidase
MAVVTERETAEVEEANRSGRTPVVFIHGLWLLPSSWDRWAQLFEDAGYAPITPSWPGEPETVEEAKANPEAFAGTSIGQVVDHTAAVVARLSKRPAIVGHSFGGLFTQILAGRGLAAASVAIDSAQYRGVLPLPISTLRSVLPVLGNPLNRNRAIYLTLDQFRYGWANALDDEEARHLHSTYHVPAPGKPIFQAGMANLNPWTEARVDTTNPERGPMLLISGEADRTIPPSIVRAQLKRQRRNPRETEYAGVPNRGHSLTIDSGWREVADAALAFVQRFV